LAAHWLPVLATFSMHYFGAADLSADYFGLFCAADFEVDEYTKTTSNTDEITKLLNRNLF